MPPVLKSLLDVSTDDITLNKSVSNAECFQKATDFWQINEIC